MCGHGALALNSQELKALNSEGYDEGRPMYEVVDAARVVLILGIIHRKDLEQWLRQQG
jgi:hypothetical protein